MDRKVITISRQYGSGGRAIGKMLSEKLNIPFFDKELINLAAEKSNINLDVASDADESVKKGLFAMFSSGAYVVQGGVVPGSELPINDRLYIVQSNIIKEIAKTTGGVIIGRCADYILRDFDNVVNIFIHSDLERRIKRIEATENLSYDEAKKLIEKTDKKRETYYNYYSDTKWGKVNNYDLAIDSKIGMENTANLIVSYLNLL